MVHRFWLKVFSHLFYKNINWTVYQFRSLDSVLMSPLHKGLTVFVGFRENVLELLGPINTSYTTFEYLIMTPIGSVVHHMLPHPAIWLMPVDLHRVVQETSILTAFPTVHLPVLLPPWDFRTWNRLSEQSHLGAWLVTWGLWRNQNLNWKSDTITEVLRNESRRRQGEGV